MNIDNQSCLKLMWGDRNQRKSNLPFQVCLYVNLWLCPAWFFINVISLDTKYHSLTNVYKGISVALFLILLICESFKLYLGYLGNLAGKIPELACCWLISTFVQLPLEMFVLFDRTISPCYGEMFISSLMVCLLLIEIIAGMTALLNLADRRAKIFYLTHLCRT